MTKIAVQTPCRHHKRGLIFFSPKCNRKKLGILSRKIVQFALGTVRLAKSSTGDGRMWQHCKPDGMTALRGVNGKMQRGGQRGWDKAAESQEEANSK